MPAVTKLFEHLAQTNFDVIFIDRNRHLDCPRNHVTRFPPFNASFYVSSALFPASLVNKPVLSKVSSFMSAFIWLKLILQIAKSSKSDMIYVDRQNVVIGAFLASVLRKRVVLRLHGVLTLYHRFGTWSGRIRHALRYLSFRAPFAHIICTEDGTPTEQFLETFTCSQTPKTILLNGVDKERTTEIDVRKKYGIPQESPVILFVGRMEKEKGGGLFVECMKRLRHLNRDFYALMVGDGALYDHNRDIAGEARNLIFSGRVPHSQIPSFYAASDIFVSLNQLGNLCNTVLEALQAGTCVVIYGSDEGSRHDWSTEQYLQDIAVMVDRTRVLDELPLTLNKLLAAPEQIQQKKMSARKWSQKMLKSWQERIEDEIRILNSVLERKSQRPEYAQRLVA